MAEETRRDNYCPVVFGEYNFAAAGPRPGQWALTLAHDLVLTDDNEQVLGHTLMAGETIYLPLGSFQRACMIAAKATEYPPEYDQPGHPVHDLAARRAEDRGWVRDFPPTLPELPF